LEVHLFHHFVLLAYLLAIKEIVALSLLYHRAQAHIMVLWVSLKAILVLNL
jgi:hypothetical protein